MATAGGQPPSPDVFLRAATQAYESQPQQIDPSFELVNSTPTMKVYINTALKQVLVGVRGTKDAADVAADLQIPLYRLEYSNRYLADVAVMRAVKQQYPGWAIYAAGHSLGGAIIDLFIRDGLVDAARSYNPAIQLRNQQAANERIYNKNDLLYKMGSTFMSNKADVRSDSVSPVTAMASSLPGVPGLFGRFARNVGAHSLNKFTGGAKPDEVESGGSKAVAQYALSEDDIRKLVGSVPIYRYPDLAKFDTPDDMFKGSKAVVLLFLTENRDTGHWLTVINHPDHIEVFDSFGVGAS